ncbi:MAG TPA: YIP1 family protein [Gaiellaceae bacterium]|nr:YIP1 family protein [Gaiellaceae bacterium]
MSASRADEIRRLERGWWRRLPLVLVRPGEVFSELRDGSDEQAEALSEPMVAVTILAGIAMFLSTATAGKLFDNPEFDWLLIAVEAFFAGVLVALQNYWLGGAALLLGLRSLGSRAPYRLGRQIVGLSTAPFVLALLVVWPVRLAVFGGDLFRSGGSDEGTAGYVLNAVDAAFVLWALVLAVAGVRAVEQWSLARSLVATAFAATLFGLLLAAAIFA